MLQSVRESFKKDRPDYGKTADCYAKYRRPFPPKLFHYLEKLGLRKGMSVLDMGTGTGVIARVLAKLGYRVTAIDIAEGMLEKAAELDKKAGVKVDYRLARAEDTGFGANSFDFIIVGRAWHWFKKAVIDEVKKIIKPGGKLVITSYSSITFIKKGPWIPTLDVIKQYNPTWKLVNKDPKSADFESEFVMDLIEAEYQDVSSYKFFSKEHFTKDQWIGFINSTSAMLASPNMTKEKIRDCNKALDEKLQTFFKGKTARLFHRCLVIVATPKPVASASIMPNPKAMSVQQKEEIQTQDIAPTPVSSFSAL